MITIRQAENIEWVKAAKHWVVTGLPARIELVAQGDIFHCGWVLIRAKLLRECRNYPAILVAETDSDRYLYDVPVSFKGTILELFELPKGVKRLFLQPMNAVGTFTLTDVSLTPVSTVKRVVRKWVRVLPLLGKKHRQRRKCAGMRLYTPLIDLKKAYQIAGRFRAPPLIPYPDWMADFDQLSLRDEKKIQQKIRSWQHPPHVQVIIHGDASASHTDWQQTLASLSRQLYPHWSITLLPTVSFDLTLLGSLLDNIQVIPTDQRERWSDSTLAQLQSAGQNQWLITLRPGAELTQHAIFWFMAEALRRPERALLYSDHDCLNEEGQRVEPHFKPDWSPELLRSSHYIGDTVALRADQFIHIAGLYCATSEPVDFHDFLLRVTERLAPSEIAHITAVLWHQPQRTTRQQSLHLTESEAVADHLQRLGVKAKVNRTDRGHYRVRYGLPADPPMISIIVPTRDMLGHLQPCVESVLSKSSYPNFELIIVDNQSVEPQTLAYFESLTCQPKVRVIPYDQPFNYSAINNYAVQQARGEIICLLNNDTVVISPDWMEEMLGHLLQTDVGIVGAKLYFADGRVQHAGDTVGPGGCADHLHSKLERHEPGYMDRAILAQDLSAVTAACLMTQRELFLSLGGLDEKNLAVAFNDVDYCLRVREAGKRVVFTPYAELYHHESVSRGKDDSPEKMKRGKSEADYMRRRWKHIMHHDPFYNPNLSYSRADFSLSHAPLVDKPWLK
ncbi:MAG: glycosyltransferase family 2 protein [Halopseudomonas sp.]